MQNQHTLNMQIDGMIAYVSGQKPIFYDHQKYQNSLSWRLQSRLDEQRQKTHNHFGWFLLRFHQFFYLMWNKFTEERSSNGTGLVFHRAHRKISPSLELMSMRQDALNDIETVMSICTGGGSVVGHLLTPPRWPHLRISARRRTWATLCVCTACRIRHGDKAAKKNCNMCATTSAEKRLWLWLQSETQRKPTHPPLKKTLFIKLSILFKFSFILAVIKYK